MVAHVATIPLWYDSIVHKYECRVKLTRSEKIRILTANNQYIAVLRRSQWQRS